MRNLALAFAASAAAMLVVSGADARPAIGGSSKRVGGDASASAKTSDSPTLIETFSALVGFVPAAKATPVAGSNAPRSAAPRIEQCEEDKKREEAAEAAESRRTAQAEKRQRGSEPVYLAF